MGGWGVGCAGWGALWGGRAALGDTSSLGVEGLGFRVLGVRL